LENTYLGNGKLENGQLENRHLENEKWSSLEELSSIWSIPK